jgi:hypothetical protein
MIPLLGLGGFETLITIGSVVLASSIFWIILVFLRVNHHSTKPTTLTIIGKDGTPTDVTFTAENVSSEDVRKLIEVMRVTQAAKDNSKSPSS